MGVVLINDQKISAADFKSIQNASVAPTNKNAAKINEALQKAAADGGFSEEELRDVAKLIKEGTPPGADPNAEIDKFVDNMKLSDPKLADSLKFEMKDKVETHEWNGQKWDDKEWGSDRTITTFVSAAPVTDEAAKVAESPAAISFEPKAEQKPAPQSTPAVTNMTHNRSGGFDFKFEGKAIGLTPDMSPGGSGIIAEGAIGPILADPAARARLADALEAAAKGKGEVWEADAKTIADALRNHPETIHQ